MERLTYDYIKPLIAREEIRGSELYCEFKCPKSGKVIGSSSSIQQSATNQVKENFKQSLFYSIQSTISSLIYRLFSSFGTVGSIVGSATSSATNSVNVNTSQKISKKEKENAVIEAFKSVLFNFYWDEKEKRWLIAKDPSPFMLQLHNQPIREKYDSETMARILTEISNLDGKITDSEKELLKKFIPADVGDIDSLLKKGKLSSAELKEIEAKESTLMLAWTAALVDENLADVEKSRLSEYAQAFGIEKEREEELKKLAQHYIIENAAAAGSLETNENLTQLADKIGITHEDAERALISYKKRS